MINLDEFFLSFGKPKGIIHIGAHFMFERNIYLKNGLSNTIWIEPNPFFYDFAKQTIFDTEEKIFNFTIGNKPATIMMSKDGLQNKHIIPNKTLDELIKEECIDSTLYNYLHIGQQVEPTISFDGVELENFDYISTEVSKNIPELNGDIIKVIEHLRKNKFSLIECKFSENMGRAIFKNNK
jgi:hypothetical protein